MLKTLSARGDDNSHNRRCDFHRFRLIFSGDKRGESGTTGAFGIGFIAVYQVTDTPELISSGLHWILHEERPEHERIEVCSGCLKCNQPSRPGTRFILPWARNPDSELRRSLRAEVVPPEGPQQMLEQLRNIIPVAMLFLKRLRRIEIKRNRRTIRVLQRLDEGDDLILSDGKPENDRIWHIVRGEFSLAASSLREKHPGRIEDKREAHIALAIPANGYEAGLLCACLPTEHDVGLPFHLNADFFTTNDRKRIIFSGDYQTEWNREALRAAARALAEALDRLPDLLGRQRLWELLTILQEIYKKASEGRSEQVLGEFWNLVAPKLRTAAIIPTTKSNWTTAGKARLLLQQNESNAIGVLEYLGIPVVHEELRPYQNLLRSEQVGVDVLDVRTVCTALADRGLNRRVKLSELPRGLASRSNLTALWAEIAILLQRQQRTARARAEDEDHLREIALAPGRDGAVWPCNEIYHADHATIALFESLGVGIPFVASDGEFQSLEILCRTFDAATAIQELSQIDAEKLGSLWKDKRLPLKQLFAWFDNRRQEVLDDPYLKHKLAALPLFPSAAGKLLPLKSLALPGNFTDPLGLTDLVDLGVIGSCYELLRGLGMDELDFSTYVCRRLPAALAGENVPGHKRRAATLLLARRAGELKDSEEARHALSSSLVVECTDGAFRRAQECHFDNDSVRDCLGKRAYIALLPKGHESAVRDLYLWLGVAAEPRLGSIVDRVRDLASEPYSSSGGQHIARIVAHLSERVKGSGDDFPELDPLKSLKWLPARGKVDRWYAPHELYAVYQDYLFETQALFLDLPRNIQNSGTFLLEYLGVHRTPETRLVVKHLLYRAEQQQAIHAEVYRFLNDRSNDPTLSPLKGKKSLWLGDAYYSPNEVFWGEHFFGRYRRRLGDELRQYTALMNQLGVRETPTWEDAMSVLREIATEFGSQKKPLDDEAHAILMACWRILDRAINEPRVRGEIQDLRSVKCVPNRDRMLFPPEWMFFENRAGLAAKFGEPLRANVIQRPLDADSALGVAGVRALGAAVKVELLECIDPKDDQAMSERTRARRNEIARVLPGDESGHSLAHLLERLESVRCQKATSIKIRYHLQAFNRAWLSREELVPALFLPHQDALLFTWADNREPWAAIARELAIALYPEEDPGRLAAGLKEAIAPASADEASAILDELGFARLDITGAPANMTSKTASSLGAEGPIEIGPPPMGTSELVTEGPDYSPLRKL